MTPRITEAINLEVDAAEEAEAANSSRFEIMNFKQKILPRPMVSREGHIERLFSQAKLALHVGCTDAPFTNSLLNSGDLLHHRLLSLFPEKVIGFDISLKNLQALQRTYPKARFVHGNAENLPHYFQNEKFDLVIAGEILEHLSNPGLFFDSCKETMTDDGTLLLTVPNVFGLRRLIHNVFGTENYHPDHTFYFSENTIKTLADRHGFAISRSFYYASCPGYSLAKKILYTFIETIPAYVLGNHFLEGIVIELKKKGR